MAPSPATTSLRITRLRARVARGTAALPWRLLLFSLLPFLFPILFDCGLLLREICGRHYRHLIVMLYAAPLKHGARVRALTCGSWMVCRFSAHARNYVIGHRAAPLRTRPRTVLM